MDDNSARSYCHPAAQQSSLTGKQIFKYAHYLFSGVSIAITPGLKSPRPPAKQLLTDEANAKGNSRICPVKPGFGLSGQQNHHLQSR
jgi:hypothetical protein